MAPGHGGDDTPSARACYKSAVRVEVRTDDDWILRGERRGPEDAPVVVVLGHAMMVDRRTMDRPRGAGLASTLVESGLEVVMLDARGHGESGPLATDGARWSYDDVVRFDVPAMVDAGRAVARGRPVVLLGHSLIGHAALITAGLLPERAPDALVAYAPNLWAPHLEPSPVARALKSLSVRTWTAWTAVNGMFDPAPFGLGRAVEAEPYVVHFQTMWRTNRLTDPSGETDYEEAMGRATLPVLAFASQNDRLLARPAAVERFLALAPRADVELEVLRGPGAPDHAGFVTKTESRPLWEKTARWILTRVA